LSSTTNKRYRLLSEAEWEYAARGGSKSSRYYGESDEDLAQYAWYSKNPPQKKTDPIDPNDPNRAFPVGMLKPNQYGLYDMYGNVWEWCDSRRLDYKLGTSIDEPDENITITIEGKDGKVTLLFEMESQPGDKIKVGIDKFIEKV